MVKITISDDEIVINGHAGYDDYGKDIVCASISSIAITTINAIVEFDNNSINVIEKDGYLKIDILKHNKEIDILISNMIDLFKNLENKYPKNIKIN